MIHSITTEAELHAFLAQMRDDAEHAWERLSAATDEPVQTGAGIALYRVSAQSGPDMIVATSDGGLYRSEWHDFTQPMGQEVYAERWTPEGRVFHGWISSVSRGILQTG
jgi:hypothetical protein